MGRIEVRNLDDDVISKLNKMAAQNHMSRESYLRNILTVAAEMDILEEQQNKYETLVREVLNLAKEQGEILEKNSLLMEMILEKEI